MLLLTVFILIALFMISYIVFDKDVLAPPTVVTLGFSFATICCFYNEKKWAIDYSSTTMWTIVVGVGSFIIGGLIAVLLTNAFKREKNWFSHNKSTVDPIDIEISKTVIVILLQLFTVVLLYVELKKITGGTTWFQTVSIFREQTAYVNPEEYTMRLSSICQLAIDLSFAIALVYAYIVGNNIAIHNKQPLINWIPIILSSVIAFMQGYRSDMIRLWIAVLIVAYTLRKRTAGWKSSKETKKMIRIMALSVVGIAVLFVALRGTVGRAETDWDPFYYLTFYAGSSIAAFDMFLKNPLPTSNIWGKETFYQLNQSIGAWFNKPELRYIFYKEYRRSPNGIYIGNIYTALRPPYYDFGFVGMIIVMMLMGVFFTLFYCKVRDRSGKSSIDFMLLIYSYIAYTFFMYFYNCYNNFISFGFIRLVMELLCFRWFLVRLHFKKTYHIR